MARIFPFKQPFEFRALALRKNTIIRGAQPHGGMASIQNRIHRQRNQPRQFISIGRRDNSNRILCQRKPIECIGNRNIHTPRTSLSLYRKSRNSIRTSRTSFQEITARMVIMHEATHEVLTIVPESTPAHIVCAGLSTRRSVQSRVATQPRNPKHLKRFWRKPASRDILNLPLIARILPQRPAHGCINHRARMEVGFSSRHHAVMRQAHMVTQRTAHHIDASSPKLCHRVDDHDKASSIGG